MKDDRRNPYNVVTENFAQRRNGEISGKEIKVD